MSVLKYYDEKLGQYRTLPLGVESVAVGNFNYSLNEEVIARWVDGRPLYRKVYLATSFSTDTKDGELIDVVDLDIKDCLELKMKIDISSEVRIIDEYIAAYYDDVDGVVRLTQKGACYRNRSLTVILEYTKDSDAPNSFDINMLSVGSLRQTASDEDVAAILG